MIDPTARPRPGLAAALRGELLKARRSRVPLVTALGFSLAPVMGGLFMVIMADPGRARRWGLITAKAQVFAGSADWPTFLGLLAQSVALGGLLLFSVLATWVFGREFVDRTARTWLAVPTPRAAVAGAKLLVVAGLSVLLTVWVLVLGLAIGAALGLPGGGGPVLASGIARVALVAALTIALLPAIALMASAGRGYMAPLGVALLLLFLAQITAATGWGDWFPWAVPALLAGTAGPEAATVAPGGYVLLAATSLATTVATLAWWSGSRAGE